MHLIRRRGWSAGTLQRSPFGDRRSVPIVSFVVPDRHRVRSLLIDLFSVPSRQQGAAANRDRGCRPGMSSPEFSKRSSRAAPRRQHLNVADAPVEMGARRLVRRGKDPPWSVVISEGVSARALVRVRLLRRTARSRLLGFLYDRRGVSSSRNGARL